MDICPKRKGLPKGDIKEFGRSIEGEKNDQKRKKWLKRGFVGSVLKKEDSHLERLRGSRH